MTSIVNAPSVEIDVNGVTFRSALLPDGKGGHFLVVNKGLRESAKVTPGMEVSITLEPDTEVRETPVPQELQRALRQSQRLWKYFLSLSPSLRAYISQHINAAKQAETRRRRSEQMAETVMEIMEAEVELPPIMRQLFARNPEAASAWNRMARSHRRGHLFVIFRSSGLDGRIRRIEKLIALLEDGGRKKAKAERDF